MGDQITRCSVLVGAFAVTLGLHRAEFPSMGAHLGFKLALHPIKFLLKVRAALAEVRCAVVVHEHLVCNWSQLPSEDHVTVVHVTGESVDIVFAETMNAAGVDLRVQQHALDSPYRRETFAKATSHLPSGHHTPTVARARAPCTARLPSIGCPPSADFSFCGNH